MEIREKKVPTTVDTLLGCGCFQGFIFLFQQFSSFLQGSNMLIMAFAKAAPRTWACLDGHEGDFNFSNGTVFNETEQCTLINSPSGCQNFTHDGIFYSIVPHWQLVCDRVKYVYLIMTLQMLGAFIGSPIFGQMSDSFGRRWTLLIAVGLLIPSGAASGFSPNWQTFAALRFIVGIAAGGTIVVNYVFIQEFLARKHRLWVTNVTGWSLAYMSLVALAYITSDWRTLTIVINLGSLPVLVLVWWIGESPRWLIQRGRVAEAEQQLRRIARYNRRSLEEQELALVLHGNVPTTVDLSVEVEKLSAPPTPVLGLDSSTQPPLLKSAKQYSYWHLFATKSMALYTVILSITYLTISLISGCIVFNVDKLSGNMYVNFAVMGGLRWISNLTVVAADLLLKKFGRRIGLIIPLLLICACSTCITLTYIFAPDYPQLKTLVLYLSMAIAMLSPPIWIMVYLSNTELSPTPIRNMSHAFCAVFNRLGGVAVPQVLYLAHFWKAAPFTVFAILSLITSILYGVFIPETKGKPLPEKMPERKNKRNPDGTKFLRRLSNFVEEDDKKDYQLVAQS